MRKFIFPLILLMSLFFVSSCSDSEFREVKESVEQSKLINEVQSNTTGDGEDEDCNENC